MNHFHRVATSIDISEIVSVLETYPEIWTGRWLPQSARAIDGAIKPGDLIMDGAALPHWLSVFFRWGSDGGFDCEPELETTAYWARKTLYAIRDVVGAERVGRLYMAKLSPGKGVPKHADADPYSMSVARFHCPITTNSGCYCIAGGERVHMEQGELWWFDHTVEHAVGNDGPTDRVHLMFDAFWPVRVNLPLELARDAA